MARVTGRRGRMGMREETGMLLPAGLRLVVFTISMQVIVLVR
jgi:hypothetical protein